jgi:nitrite reductase/ring-hydroxylating ferredoxin subunit
MTLDHRSATDRTVGQEERRRRRDAAGRTPTEWHVGKEGDFPQGRRAVFQLGDREVGVFRHAGRLRAYENLCMHQGGPVCDGELMPKVEPVLDGNRVVGERFSETETHLVCPWHGWEYDLATGECATDRRIRLNVYEVIQRGDDVYVIT